MLYELNAKLVRVLLAFAALMIFFLCFLVVGDILGRNLFNTPVKGTPELVAMSIVIICFLLAGYAVQSGSMIAADIVVSLFGVRGIAFGQLLSAVLGVLLFGLIVWGSYEPTLHAISSGEFEGEGSLRIPVWPARLVVLVGSVLVIASYLLLGARAVTALITGRDEDQPPVAPIHL